MYNHNYIQILMKNIIDENMISKKVRFKLGSVRGYLLVEDLWNLSLTSKNNQLSLDKLVKLLNKERKSKEKKSFITDLKLDILNHIIKIKKAEIKLIEDTAITNTQIRKLQSAIIQKEDESLTNQSLGDLKKSLKKLQKI